MYQWVIVGGGIQGSMIAAHLLHYKKVNKNDLLIIDPFEQPMTKWKALTKRVGMSYLRSPSVHHLDPDPYSLKKYAKNNDYAGAFLGYYGRPRLDMFNQHCDDLVHREGVQDCWRQGFATGLERESAQWLISIDHADVVEAERVILALGVNNNPHYPDWAADLLRHKPTRVHHIFSENAETQQGRITIVGGGITAAHMAKSLAEKASEPVNLIKRHSFRVEGFDSDPGWLGPKYLHRYHRTRCYQKRRNLIQEARNRGSITKGLRSELKTLEQKGKLTIITDEINEAAYKNKEIKLKLMHRPAIYTENLILATGAEPCLPGKEWLEKTIVKHDLPCAPCGFPIVNQKLEWGEGLFVAGALAELEIGPAARNIAGGRKAAERIVHA
ncbi:FAD/NAD(P)-binding protein [Halobacillus sp. B23F22_1]|uniref:FAD/NAD(P)-binding protein n=1 Tax=Halobacillus sp. B23F22_1 TaxID=3459514 RepID=UPI00373F7DD5